MEIVSFGHARLVKNGTVALLDGEDAILLESMGRMDLKECTIGLILLEPAYMRNEENYFSPIFVSGVAETSSPWTSVHHHGSFINIPSANWTSD